MAPNKNKGKGKGKKADTDTSEKELHCKNCKQFHSRPVGKACKRPLAQSTSTSQEAFTSNTSHDASDVTYTSIQPPTQTAQDPMALLLQKLDNIERQQKVMSDRIHHIESKQHTVTSTSSPIKPLPDRLAEPEIIPSLDFLRNNN